MEADLFRSSAKRITLFPELGNHESNPSAAITLEVYLYALKTASNYKLDTMQTSALFTILKKTHEFWTYAPFSYLNDVFKYFKELFVCHSVHNPPRKMRIFRNFQLEQIMGEIVHVYFRHAPLFKYIALPQLHLDFTLVVDGVNRDAIEKKQGRLLNVIVGPTTDLEMKDVEDSVSKIDLSNSKYLMNVYQELAHVSLTSQRELPGMTYEIIQKAFGSEECKFPYQYHVRNHADMSDSELENSLIMKMDDHKANLFTSNTTTSFANTDEDDLSEAEAALAFRGQSSASPVCELTEPRTDLPSETGMEDI